MLTGANSTEASPSPRRTPKRCYVACACQSPSRSRFNRACRQRTAAWHAHTHTHLHPRLAVRNSPEIHVANQTFSLGALALQRSGKSSFWRRGQGHDKRSPGESWRARASLLSCRNSTAHLAHIGGVCRQTKLLDSFILRVKEDQLEQSSVRVCSQTRVTTTSARVALAQPITLQAEN